MLIILKGHKEIECIQNNFTINLVITFLKMLIENKNFKINL